MSKDKECGHCKKPVQEGEGVRKPFKTTFGSYIICRDCDEKSKEVDNVKK